MTAADLARHALWSDHHPLGHLYAIAHGQWIGGAFVPAGAWSLRELRQFAEQLPVQVIRNLSPPPTTGATP